MKEINGINHVGIRVRNLDVSRKFYESLGFDFIAGPMGPEPVAVMEHPSGINLNFILNATPGENTNLLMDLKEKHSGYTHIALTVNDLSSIHLQLVEKEIEITEGPISLDDGAKMLFIRDPDKNVIEFHQP